MYRNLEGELTVLNRYIEEEPPIEIPNQPIDNSILSNPWNPIQNVRNQNIIIKISPVALIEHKVIPNLQTPINLKKIKRPQSDYRKHVEL